MPQSFSLLHQSKTNSGAEMRGSEGALTFETCRRKILILPSESEESTALRGPEAYQFLLEVICGAHSPLFGETEILGQFKKFVQDHEPHPSFFFFKKWSQQLLTDAKEIRSRYLRGHLTHSYGSLLRKKIPVGTPLAIVGAGLLTESLLPWLSQSPIRILARDPAKAQLKFPNQTIVDLSAELLANEWTLIAAPLDNEDLSSFLRRAPRQHVWIDLREKAQACALKEQNLQAPLSSLEQLWAEVEKNKSELIELRTQVLSAIERKSIERSLTISHRPWGWEDLCVS